MSLNATLLDEDQPVSDEVVVMHDDEEENTFSSMYPSTLAEYRASELNRFESKPTARTRMRGRVEWSVDASDEMIFHWVCSSKFNEQELDVARQTCTVRWNPLYWIAFLATFLSLFVGREFHILLSQGGPVNMPEARQEYEVRVHWVYCTSGAMLWVAARSVMTLLYDAAISERVNLMEEVVCWIIVSMFCAGNSVFLRMMRLRSLAGVRCIVICNFVFTACMFASLCYYIGLCAKHNNGDDDDDDDDDNEAQCKTHGEFWPTVYIIFLIFEKLVAVLFFIVATIIYARLWSQYKFDGRDLKQRLCETIPAILAAVTMLLLMFIALVFKNDALEPYVWATFTRR